MKTRHGLIYDTHESEIQVHTGDDRIRILLTADDLQAMLKALGWGYQPSAIDEATAKEERAALLNVILNGLKKPRGDPREKA